MRSLFTALFSLLSITSFSQKGQIQGFIKTSDQQPAAYMKVFVVGTSIGCLVDTTGHYQLVGITPGIHTIRASFTGVTPVEKQVQVIANQITHVDFIMETSGRLLRESVISANPGKYVTDYPSISLRLKTPLLEIPQNIQVVTNKELDDQQIFDMLEGVTRNVSGVTRMEHWDNYAQLNMRGSQISGFRNGMNVQSTWGPLTEDLSMVERIEFVKGPAGFMLANGEPSGFYNVVTKKPTGMTKGEATMSVGSFNLFRTTLDLDGKFSDNGKVLYRLNVMGSMKDSHRKNEYSNRLSLAPVLKFKLSEHTSLTTEYTYQQVQMSPLGSNYAFAADGMGTLPIDFSTAEAQMDPTNISDHSLLMTLVHQWNSNWKFTGQMGYFLHEQEGQTLWPSSVSQDGDTLYRGMSNWDILGITKVGQFFVNGDVNAFGTKHRLLMGLDMGDKDYFHDWSQGGAIDPLYLPKPVYGQVASTTYPTYDRSKNIRQRGVHYTNAYQAIYIQDELHLLSDKLRLTLAGRYTSVDDIDPYSGTGTSSKFTPRFGLSYNLFKNTSLYGVYDVSFVPQMGSDYHGKAFKPITGNNLELGIKQDWLDGKWSMTVSGFQITKNNVLTSDPNHQYFSIQLGQTKTSGIEFDVRGQVIENLNFIMNYAYNNGRVTKDTDASRIGNQLAGTSRNIANTWLNYRISSGLLEGLGISGGVQFAGGRSNWYGAYDQTIQTIPDYFRVDGAVSYHADRFSISLNANNLLDSHLFSGAYYTYSNFYYWQAEAKRNTRLTIAYRF